MTWRSVSTPGSPACQPGQWYRPQRPVQGWRSVRDQARSCSAWVRSGVRSIRRGPSLLVSVSLSGRASLGQGPALTHGIAHLQSITVVEFDATAEGAESQSPACGTLRIGLLEQRAAGTVSGLILQRPVLICGSRGNEQEQGQRSSK